MKIRREKRAGVTLAELAEAHDLTMHVLERNNSSIQATRRFRASFDDCLVNVPLLGLQYKYGFGATEEEAIQSYARNLEGQPLHILSTHPATIMTCPSSLPYP